MVNQVHLTQQHELEMTTQAAGSPSCMPLPVSSASEHLALEQEDTATPERTFDNVTSNVHAGQLLPGCSLHNNNSTKFHHAATKVELMRVRNSDDGSLSATGGLETDQSAVFSHVQAVWRSG